MKISDIIIDWYKKNKRNLPWRESHDPYRIWLSEVILQQTRVDQGLAYYHRFVAQYPDVFSLAAADEQAVMKLWQGLGYYSRARNLLTAARQIVNNHNGVFPGERTSLLQLKGVGAYTASAVASIAFNEPVAVVDGNVARVLSRLFTIEEPVNTRAGEKMIEQLAEELLDRQQPGEYNQALMEFGALQCVPANRRRSRSALAPSQSPPTQAAPSSTVPTPNCPACPLNIQCLAFSQNNVDRYPVKLKKVKVKQRYFTYLVISHNGYTYIQQRTDNDIWKQMFEFPLIEHDAPIKPEALGREIERFTGLQQKDAEITGLSEPVRHQLTHRTINARFVHLRVLDGGFSPPRRWRKILPEEIADHPLPRLIDRYLELHPDLEG